MFSRRKKWKKRITHALSRGQSSLEGGGSKVKGGGKHDVLSLSPDLAKLYLKCHMNYSNYFYRFFNVNTVNVIQIF